MMTRMRIRSGFLLTALALVLTGAVGLVAERDRPAEAHEEELDELARSEHAGLGWRAPRDGEVKEAADALLASSGVELLVAMRGFELPLPNGVVSGDAGPEEATAAAAALVARELARLPAGFLAAARLRRVVLVGGLREGRAPIPSLPNYKGTLLLDVVGSPRYLERLLHHEVFHFADLADDDTVVADPAWAALNPPDFRYGRGGRSMREPDAGALDAAPIGFPSRYATSALEEDKAEVFALLMAAPAELDTRLAGDPVLAEKVARVRELTAALSPEMDARFWRGE
jgi:hypothetical protein